MTEATSNLPQGRSEIHRSLATSGKYITFKLADEEYGFEILKVREIIGMMDITKMPNVDDTVRGVINLRGKINPVIDLRKKFKMSETIPTDQTVIVIVQLNTGTNTNTIGILVDEVQEVLSVDKTEIEPPPQLGDSSDQHVEYITGIAKVNKRVIFLLDIKRIFASGNFSHLTPKDTN